MDLRNTDAIVINDYVDTDPLSVENLDKVLNLINEKRISFGDTKLILIHTEYEWEKLFNCGVYTSKEHAGLKRRNIVKQCDVLIEETGNFRFIYVKESMKQDKAVIYGE